ncbi:MAG: CRTAC1 family protein [Alphaproteobacteria bacterium]
MKRLLALLILMMAFPAAATEMPRFTPETESGIEHGYDGDNLFMTGGGVAAFDCSGDGLPELFFAGGASPAALYVNRSTPGGRGASGGALKFSPVTQSPTILKDVTGAYPLDIDGDGITDLAVLRVGENVLFRGRGDCQFERANEAWNFDGGDRWTVAFSATWEKGRDWPTLAFGNFMDRATIIMDYGDCDASWLFRPSENGGYAEPMAITPGHCANSMLFSDWNRDGHADLRVSNDQEFYRGGAEQLFRLGPSGGVPLTSRDGWQTVNIWGMGIASSDITGDGYPDYYLTNMAENRFEVLADGATGPTYEDRAVDFNVAVAKPFTGGDIDPSTAWHAEFGDVNNDGLADLLVVKGNVVSNSANAKADPNNLLIQTSGGVFVEAAKTAGALSFRVGRGGALVDLNNDGALDLVVSNRNEPSEIWRNASDTSGNWLKLNLVQGDGNRTAIGAWVEVRANGRVQRREITVGGGHAGGQFGALHFGLGDAESAEVRVQWPYGGWGTWRKLSANTTTSVRREAAKVIALNKGEGL